MCDVNKKTDSLMNHGRVKLSWDDRFGDEYGLSYVSKDPCFESKDDLMCDPSINYENE